MKVRISLGDISLERKGSGPPLILIHGLGADKSLWDYVLTSFSHDFEVISYDLMGSGQSKPDAGYIYSIGRWSKDLEELLVSLQISKASILGWSLGSMIAMRGALDYPTLVKSLVLVGASSSWFPEAIEIYEKRASMAEREGMKKMVDETFYSTQAAFSKWTLINHPEKIQDYRQMLERNDKNMFAASCRATSKIDLTSQISQIHCPTLIVSGKDDVRTPVASSEEIHSRIAGSLHQKVPDCGHFHPLEHPEIFKEMILPFLLSKV